MTRLERVALQRQKAREALGVLRGIEELFGVDDEADSDISELKEWKEKLREFEDWVFDESPIA